MIHWRAVKKMTRYLQRTKDLMLIFQGSDDLHVVEYLGYDLARCRDGKKSTSGYMFTLAGEAIFGNV